MNKPSVTDPISAPSPPHSNLGLIIGSIVTVSAIGAASIIAIVLLRPHEDNAVLITSILGFLGPTAAALLALIKASQTGAAVQELHLAVNSRLTQLLELTAKASKAEGRGDALATVASAAAAADPSVAVPLVAALTSPTALEPPKK